MPQPLDALRWLVLGAACVVAAPASAHPGNDHDHDRARQAVEAGEILPLSRVLERVEQRYPGQVVDVGLIRDRDGRWVYRVKLLQRGGALIHLRVDARDGSVSGNAAHERGAD